MDIMHVQFELLINIDAIDDDLHLVIHFPSLF